MKHPHVFCQLDTLDRIYTAKEYELHQERQRPTLGYFELEEPIAKDSLVILELGYLNKAYRITVLKVTSCSQVGQNTYDVVAIEATRSLLDAAYVDQLVGVTLESSLKRISRHIGLKLKVQGVRTTTKTKTLWFLDSIRNALDQVWLVFELKQARWMINLFTSELVFLPLGKLEGDPLEIPMDYFKRETAGGIEMEIVPLLKPYAPVIWRGEEKIVDVSRINSKTGTQFISFAEAE
ncbi:hypothetical protein KJ966_24565 [bacterium]|nr:hypothetical protein [bacterium]